jgi:proteic killer suppression protein
MAVLSINNHNGATILSRLCGNFSRTLSYSRVLSNVHGMTTRTSLPVSITFAPHGSILIYLALDRYKQIVYNLLMIQNFATYETEQFYTTGKSRRLPTEILKRAAMRLIQLNAATRIEDLRLPPSNKLEALTHDRAGQWSIRINDQWRVCFRFENGDALDVEIVDYH